MKKFMLNIFLILIFVLSCSIDDQPMETGNAIIRTPTSLEPLMKSIVTDDGEINIKDYRKNFRFEITIETNNIPIQKVDMGTDTEKVIEVPAGIPLNFYLGVYLSENTKSKNEIWNSYVLSDNVKNKILMPNQSTNINFKVKLSQDLPVKVYHNSVFKDPYSTFYAVTGSVYDDKPYFSIFNYSAGASIISSKLISYDSNFEEENISCPIGIIKYMPGSKDGEIYWNIHPTGIYSSTLMNETFESIALGSQPLINSILNNYNNLKKIKYINHIRVPAIDYDRNYYFFSHKDGFIAMNYNGHKIFNPGAEDSFSELKNKDFDFFRDNYPLLPFLLDTAYDNGNNEANMIFFATKMGFYYVKEQHLALFGIESGIFEGIQGFKNIIRISDDNNTPILTTSIADYKDKKTYIGTKKGLYEINKNSSDWNSFKTKSENDTVNYLENKAIKKIKTFPNEPVFKTEIIENTSKGDILIVTTPSRIWLYNLNSGSSDQITIYDGMPFIPYKTLPNTVYDNFVDFSPHYLSQVLTILYDPDNDCFWFGTLHGLASVQLNRLSL